VHCFAALDGSYAAASVGKTTGRFVAALPAKLVPVFAKASRWQLDANALVLTSNLGLAYIAHYNAPAFYKALADRSRARFRTVCTYAFGILSLLYLVMMLLGHRTFGDVTSANILRNYAPSDPLAILGRFATFASILFGFPLAMLGLKDSTVSLLQSAASSGVLGQLMHKLATTWQDGLTLGMLLIISTIAILVSDIGLVVGISGALLGAAIVYIFPALIYGRVRQACTNDKRGLDVEMVATYALIPLGTFLGVLGVWMTLAGA
jgi:amino acid permease